MVTVEICVADVGGARAAEQGGAHRVEVCQALEIGGITPSRGFLMDALEHTERLGISVLIRPCGGGFVYSEDELRVMEYDIADIVRQAGNQVGFAFGVLTPSGEVDIAAMRCLVNAAQGRRVCCQSLRCSVDRPDWRLYSNGVRATLTSGGGGPANANREQLRRLTKITPQDCAVIAAGGVRASHVVELVRATGLAHVHLEASKRKKSALRVVSEYDSGTIVYISSKKVREIVQKLAVSD